jgi:3-oxoacyl-[acyl-carrier-protein] synthase III
MIGDPVVGIAGIGYALGAPVEFSSMADQADILAKLRITGRPGEAGLGVFRIIEGDIFDVVASSVRKTLQGVPITPDQIDAVIFCTSTVTDVIDRNRHGIACVLRENGVPDAYAMTLGFTTCASFPTALQLAEALILRGVFKNILVILADRYSAKHPTIVSQTTCRLCSDGVASCIVSASHWTQYAVIGISLVADVDLMQKDLSDHKDSVRFLDLLRRACNGALRKANVKKSRIRQFFLGNYLYEGIKILSRPLGLDEQQVFRENILRIGHCYSADYLINLKDFADTRGVQLGDEFVLVSTGVGQIGVTVLRALTSSRPIPGEVA